MKDSGTMTGGSLNSNRVSICELYYSHSHFCRDLIQCCRCNLPLEMFARLQEQGNQQPLRNFHSERTSKQQSDLPDCEVYLPARSSSGKFAEELDE